MQLTLNKICEITGKDRKTIVPRLADVPFKKGPNKSQLYESSEALEAIYLLGQGTLDKARTEQALSQARLNTIREEDLRRERIPLSIAAALWDAALQAFAAALKASRGKTLDTARINSLLAKLRNVKLPVKW